MRHCSQLRLPAILPQIPQHLQRSLGCGPPDFVSRVLTWRSAASEGSAPTVCIGVRVKWAGATPSC